MKKNHTNEKQRTSTKDNEHMIHRNSQPLKQQTKTNNKGQDQENRTKHKEQTIKEHRQS